MRLRTLIGFGIGYVLGARSDTKRYENMQQLFETIAHSPMFKGLMEQAKQAAAQGMQSLTGSQPSWGQVSNGQETARSQQSEQGSDQESEESSEESSEENSGKGKRTSGKQQASSGKSKSSSGS
jgi:hypothetical protein